MAYFDDSLAELTGGDPARPLVFYCDANCWMGYNAAKRAVRELGYRNVYWYPEGVQGWRERRARAGQAEPVPDAGGPRPRRNPDPGGGHARAARG